MAARGRVFYETKTQPTWRLVQDEPEDVDLLEDAQAWSRVYGELVHTLSVLAVDRGSPQVLDRLAEAEKRWAWWRQRTAQLARGTQEPA